MSGKESVIAVLIEAVAKDPNDWALRLHVASLLLEEARGQEALEQLGVVLGTRPDDLEALRLAARAADSVGQKELCDRYRRVLASLSGRPLFESLTVNSPRVEDAQVDEVNNDEEVILEYDDLRPKDVNESSVTSTVNPDAVSLDSVLNSSDEIWEFEKPELKLADVAGMDHVKQRLQSGFLGPLKRPDLMKHYGKSLRGGLLLYGPPGCGKTFIARATAGELGAKFVSVGLPDVLDMWLGNSEKNLHEIFELARRRSPCVLFFDELDALGRKRTLVRHSAVSGVVNQLLAEMDSIGNNNEGVFVLAATNHPWDVDTALRRPGRLDRMLLVLPPDLLAREAILRFHLRERPVEKLDLKSMARRTDGFSGADLAHLCESAVEIAIEDSIRAGNVRSIKMDDMNVALKSIASSTRDGSRLLEISPSSRTTVASMMTCSTTSRARGCSNLPLWPFPSFTP